jgi:hypothetical protein
MNSIFAKLLVIASPLFAVVASGKKKATPKPTKKSVAPKPKPARAKVKKSPAPAKKVIAKKPAAPQVAAPKKAIGKSPAPKTKAALSKADQRKGNVPAKPEPKVATPPPPPPPPAPKPSRPAGRPILLSPENGKYAESINPKLRWLSVGGASRYEAVWSQDPNLINGYSIVSISTEATVPLEKPLAVGVTYYWHVRGGNEAGWGPWSMAASFSVLEEEGSV